MRFVPALASAFVALFSLPSADATVVRSGGLLGGALAYELDGDPFELYVLLPSFQLGPTPLASIDPGETRILAVGTDLAGLARFGALDADGGATVVYALPLDGALQGLALHAQLVTLDGSFPDYFDELSSVTSFALSAPDASTYALGDLPDAIDLHSLTELDDGRVLVAGGVGVEPLFGLDVPLDGFLTFDPATQSFETVTGAAMQHARYLHSATKLADGRVLIVGGIDETEADVRASADLFDPTTGTCTPAAPMLVPRIFHTATLLADGRVLVFGGLRELDMQVPPLTLTKLLASGELYDPALDAWTAVAASALPRAGHAATLLPDGRVLVTGGIANVAAPALLPGYLDESLLFDPTIGVFTAAADMPTACAWHASTRLDDGRVLVAGGFDAIDLVAAHTTATTATATYDAATDAWTSAGALGKARGLHTLLTVNGDVVALGGFEKYDCVADDVANTIERAPQLTLAWSTGSNVLETRPNARSVAIEGGERILTTGRAGSTAEIYHP